MKLTTLGPFRTSLLSWQLRPRTWALTLTCRAAFELSPGESRLVPMPAASPSETQVPGDDRELLERASVSTPAKRWPEVIVVGNAYAPDGAPVTDLVARLSVGDLEKAVHVFGDRHFSKDGALHRPKPFSSMPLRWDRAAGGPDTWNPAGVRMGADAVVDGSGRVLLPNFQPAGSVITARGDLVAPAGFGPIAPSWPGRALLAKRYAGWDPTRWSERPLPDDFDLAYFNAAPTDQVLPELTGGERILLEHLHPRFARLSTHLRGVAPRAVASVEGQLRDVELRCDTLAIDTDRGLAVLSWRGHLVVDQPEPEGLIAVTAGESLPGVEAAAPPSEPTKTAPWIADTSPTKTAPWTAVTAPKGTFVLAGVPAKPPTPFAAPPSPAVPKRISFGVPPIKVATSAAGPSMPGSDPRFANALRAFRNIESPTGTVAPIEAALPKPTLPFGAAGPSTSEDDPRFANALRAFRNIESPTGTVAPIGPTLPKPTLPFVGEAPAGVPQSISFGNAPPPLAPEKPPVSSSGSVFESASGYAPAPASESAPVSAPAPVSASAPVSAPVSVPAPVSAPVPPPMWGPLAAPEIEAADTAAEDEKRKVETIKPPPTDSPEEPSEAYTLVRCAAIAARIARRPEEVGAVLEAERLSGERWEAAHERWLAAIRAETGRGKKALLSEYDAAYVKALEEERGPITADEYARLVIAAERGQGQEALVELGLPGEAMMRIRRVWLARIVKDAEEAARVRTAMRAAADA